MKFLRDSFRTFRLFYAFLVIGAMFFAGLSGCFFFKEPESCYDASIYRAIPYQTISFSNCSLNGDSYLWDFGDGTTSTEENPTHAYSEYGTYEVNLTSTLKEDKTHTVTQSIVVGDLVLEEIQIYNFFTGTKEPVTFSILDPNGSLVRSPSFIMDSDLFILKMDPELVLPDSNYTFIFDAQSSGRREVDIPIYDQVDLNMQIRENNPVDSLSAGFHMLFKSR